MDSMIKGDGLVQKAILFSTPPNSIMSIFIYLSDSPQKIMLFQTASVSLFRSKIMVVWLSAESGSFKMTFWRSAFQCPATNAKSSIPSVPSGNLDVMKGKISSLCQLDP